MFKTFMNEFRHMMKSKWRLASYILLLIIPTIYGFVTMNAFWKPFHHVDRLKVAVLNLDAGAKGKTLEKSIIDKKEVVLGSQKIGLNIQSIDGIYNTRDEAKKAVDDGKYSAIIVIPKGYTDAIAKAESKVAQVVTDKINPATITRMVDAMLKELKGNEVEFINSFKHNFLGGVMTNMGAAIDQLAKDALTAGASSTSPISKLLMSMKDKKLVIDHHIIGEHIDVYGKGFSPFFIAISLWAGALATTFIIKNQRFDEKIGTVKHYLGKTMTWLMTGWIQSILLVLAISLQGVLVEGSWTNQWRLLLMVLAISTLFNLTIQGISFMVRFGDIGEFIIVILMVLNLVASAGTFPVFMQTGFFQAISPYLPFTYSVDLVRQMLHNPDTTQILIDLGKLLVWPTIFVTLGFGINFAFDRHTRTQDDNGQFYYRSLEQHTGDL